MAGNIRQGYQPGCIGDVAGLHARFYSKASGFGVYFEAKVAIEFAEFARSLPSPTRALWLHVDGGRTLASLAIDGSDASDTAHLRWFIVDDALRGTGTGRQLLTLAMEFVDAHFNETILRTFKGLDAARHLYESVGFVLEHEAEGAQWGTTVAEQQFRRRSRRSGS